ncbi:hypothetical protein [Achromobacter spanius]|uniref:hypothetical protein n=1 Tax=Achromobacter spanius TaxID=217203 RepID=UPI003F68BEF7
MKPTSMSARVLIAVWKRARHAGWDLDAVCYLAGVVGGVAFLAAMTGALGPTLDAEPQQHQAGTDRHAAR